VSTRLARREPAAGSRAAGPWRTTAPVALAAACAMLWAALHATAGAQGAATLQNAAEPHRVAFTDDGLRPAILAVPLGATVLWVNETAAAHNTTHVPDLGQPVAWSSGTIDPDGGTFEHAFLALGTYYYIDALFPDELDFQGTVIVTPNDPTATPLVPTAGPTPTDGPTATPRPPTPTVPPTPTGAQPTSAPVVLVGRLERASLPECHVDAALVPCDDPTTTIHVRGDGAIDPALFGRDVRLEGVMMECAAAETTYLWLFQAAVWSGGCQPVTATATPSPTTQTPSQPGQNLAAGRPVTAKGPELPGFEPERLTDGNPATFWYSDHPVSWAYVDLGEPRAFNQVRLRWSAPYAERYGIYVWEDGAWRGKLVVDNARGGEDVRTLTYTEARYVLLYLMTSSAPGGGFALGEWEVYGEPRPNWALGQPVIASSDQGGHVGAYANDGLMGTFWVSARGDPNPWLAVYLPASVEMTEFRLWWTTAFPRTYSLVFFEGGRRTLYSPVQMDRGGLHRLVGRVPVSADTVMIYTHQNAPEGYVGLQEVEILGPGPRSDADAEILRIGPVGAWLHANSPAPAFRSVDAPGWPSLARSVERAAAARP